MASETLNLNVSNLITGVNIIDGMLLFTDNRNEPRKINIARFRDEGVHTSGTTQIYGRDFETLDISLIKKHPSTAATFAIASTDLEDSVFKNVFPRFSYRWKYNDNEYSPFAPFTEVIYQGKALDLKEVFETGEIAAVQNVVDSVTITVPTTQKDVIEIDLLYTESISSTVYIAETKKLLASDITAGTVSFTVNTRNFFKAVSGSQLTRIFDKVPRKAKAQDLTGNRVIYGNYLENYDNTTVDGSVSYVSGATVASKMGVRSNSKYTVGVAFSDQAGRLGDLIDLGGVETPFSPTGPLSLTCQLSGTVPSWATNYRYYIKDTTGQRHNIKSYAAFDEEVGGTTSSEVWIAVQSEDVNKVQEGDFIYHKAQHRTDSFVGLPGQANASYGNTAPTAGLGAIQPYNKRKVIEIKAEAPDSVKYGLVNRNRLAIKQTWTTHTFWSLDITNGNYVTGHTPTISDDYIAIEDVEVATAITEELENSKIVYISLGTNTSHKTRITSVSAVDIGGVATSGSLIQLANKLSADAVSGINSTSVIKIYSGELSNEQLRVLDGKFFIKTTRYNIGFVAGSGSIITTDPNTAVSFPHLIDDTAFTNAGTSMDLFTVEANADSNLDLFWEASNAFAVSATDALDFGQLNVIDWSNCISFARNGTSRPILDIEMSYDRYNSIPVGKGVRVTTPTENEGVARYQSNLIFSGIMNPGTSLNKLNQFIEADGITKDINPKYGSIQKIYSSDNLTVFCEDRIVKVLANKDALYNADESANLIATSNVLGQVVAYKGLYGIAKNPESFAAYGNDQFFSDRIRGAVLKLTPANGQIIEISKSGMRDFFRDRLPSATNILGSFDIHSNKYILTIKGYNATLGDIDVINTIDTELDQPSANMTLGYYANGQTQGWTSRYSFIPDSGVSVDGKYYTFKDGKIWRHHASAASHNNFYDIQYNSQVEFIFNDNPTLSNEWTALNYEGTEGWEVVHVKADQENNITLNAKILDNKWFVKEGKYFAPITGEENVYTLVFAGVPNSEGEYPTQDSGVTRPVAGVKGFFNKVKMKNDNTTKEELFAVSAEYYVSDR